MAMIEGYYISSLRSIFPSKTAFYSLPEAERWISDTSPSMGQHSGPGPGGPLGLQDRDL